MTLYRITINRREYITTSFVEAHKFALAYGGEVTYNEKTERILTLQLT